MLSVMTTPLRVGILPNLAEIPVRIYQNVLCSGVLMHLQYEDLGDSGNLSRDEREPVVELAVGSTERRTTLSARAAEQHCRH